jgi:hypothetical protein
MNNCLKFYFSFQPLKSEENKYLAIERIVRLPIIQRLSVMTRFLIQINGRAINCKNTISLLRARPRLNKLLSMLSIFGVRSRKADECIMLIKKGNHYTVTAIDH